MSTARTGARTTAGQARSSVERTTRTAETTARQTAGQARSAVQRTTKIAETTTKQTIGQAKYQAGATGAAGRTAAGELLDDATAAVDPNTSRRGIAYEEWTKAELYDRAQELDIEGRSSMSKRQLIAALRSA